MQKLSDSTRTQLINHIAEWAQESLDCLSREDRLDIVTSGYKGLNDYTDLELFDDYVSAFSHMWENPMPAMSDDAVLNALKQLWHVVSEADRPEVQRYITDRQKEINFDPTEVEIPQFAKEMQEFANVIKKELGL